MGKVSEIVRSKRGKHNNGLNVRLIMQCASNSLLGWLTEALSQY